MTKAQIKQALQEGKTVIVQFPIGTTIPITNVRIRGGRLQVRYEFYPWRNVYEGEVTIEGTPSEAYADYQKRLQELER